jgi:hypothetical protein
MSATVTGGCLCGAVRYEARGPGSPPALCHCRSCRHAAGAPVVAWTTWPAAEFAWIAGEPALHQSSAAVTRSFCGRCGTMLTYRHDDHAEWIDVTVCSLDDAAAHAPTDQIWTEDRLPWMTNLDALPAHARTRTVPGGGEE